MKKKLAAIAMATAMAASLAACSSKPAETTAAAEENEETTAEAAEGQRGSRSWRQRICRKDSDYVHQR